MNNVIILKIFEGDWLFILPEIFLLISLLFLLSFCVIYKELKIIPLTIYLSIFIFFIVFFLYYNLISYNYEIFNSLFISSKFIVFFKLFLITVLIIIFILSFDYFYYENIKTFEFFILIGFSVFGMLSLLSCNDFISFYLALELQSLSLYILASYKQFSNYSTEAGIKYFILGAVSSGLILFGISLVYGLTGLTNFNDLSLFLTYSYYNLDYFIYGGLIISLLLILSGFLFKIGSVPFHMWLPDVYEGVSTITTAFFSLVPKIAILGLLSRFNFIILDSFYFNWSNLFIICGLGSIFIGTFGALAQTKIKRLLAYSAISHVGFLLLALSSFNLNGLNSFVVYILIYTILGVILFSVILSLRKFTDNLNLKNIYDLKILVKSNILLSIFFSLALFSIAGVPPLAGFFSKMLVFFSAVQNQFFFIIFSFLILSMIGAFYYLRLIKIMYFDLNSNNSLLLVPSRLSSYLIVIFSYININIFFFANFFFIKINEVIINIM